MSLISLPFSPLCFSSLSLPFLPFPFSSSLPLSFWDRIDFRPFSQTLASSLSSPCLVYYVLGSSLHSHTRLCISFIILLFHICSSMNHFMPSIRVSWLYSSLTLPGESSHSTCSSRYPPQCKTLIPICLWSTQDIWDTEREGWPLCFSGNPTVFSQQLCSVTGDKGLCTSEFTFSRAWQPPSPGKQNGLAVIMAPCLNEGQSHSSLLALGESKVCRLRLYLGSGELAQQEENLEKQGRLPIKTTIVL